VCNRQRIHHASRLRSLVPFPLLVPPVRILLVVRHNNQHDNHRVGPVLDRVLVRRFGPQCNLVHLPLGSHLVHLREYHRGSLLDNHQDSHQGNHQGNHLYNHLYYHQDSHQDSHQGNLLYDLPRCLLESPRVSPALDRVLVRLYCPQRSLAAAPVPNLVARSPVPLILRRPSGSE